jgi:hypothetical protein
VRRAAGIGLALVVAAGALATWRLGCGPDLPPPPSAARLDALRAERDVLQARLRAAVVENGEKSLGDTPKAGLLIGIPTSLTTSIVEQIVTGLFGETTLTLKNLKVHKEGDVKVKMLFSKKRVGAFVLDVKIHQVQGLLRPGTPGLVFGRNAVDVTLPVRLAEGRGDALLRLQWDSKGMAANMVCGDVDVNKAVNGGVTPQDYLVKGRFSFAADGEAIVLRPQFPDLAVRIFVDPSEEAWSVVDGVVHEQRKGCEMALEKVDLRQKLGALLGRGFNVKVPQKIFKPIRLPAGVRQSLKAHGIELSLEARSAGLVVANDRIWYGADLSFRTNASDKTPTSPSPPPATSGGR